jgi:hypothetical protein
MAGLLLVLSNIELAKRYLIESVPVDFDPSTIKALGLW